MRWNTDTNWFFFHSAAATLLILAWVYIPA